MSIDLNWIHDLAEFYKYCNSVYDNNKKNILLPNNMSWTCYFRPYLIDNKVKHSVHVKLFKKKGLVFCQFKNCLIVSLQNYLNYIKNFPLVNSGMTAAKIENLVEQIIFLQETQLIEIIENNYTIFPNKKNT